MGNQGKYKFNNLEYKTNKNNLEVDRKENKELELKSIPELISQPKVLYDSGWEVCTLEKYNEAVSTTYEEFLPQKATYDFTQRIRLAEDYLPFLRYYILFKTVPEQSLKNVGEFTFTSLRDLQLQLYDWQGITQEITTYNLSPFQFFPASGWRYVFYDDRSLSAIPINLGGSASDFWSPPPQPSGAYEYQAYWNTIKIVNVLSGIGPYPLSADGTQINSGAGWTSLNTWINGVYDTYGLADDFQCQFHASASASNTFRVDANNYPVPIGVNANYVLPYNTGTDQNEYSTATYPNQYWIAGNTATFDELINIYGWSYSDAEDVFIKFYPNVILTHDEDSGEYHAYEQVENNVIKSCNQQIFYDKLDTKEFNIRVKGEALLMSKAITETSYSDPNNPTYEPNGEDLYVRLVLIVEPKIRTLKIKNYDK
ncbi:MAG: hypothetical protein ACTSWR_12330 [Candidatus Helarchaeota archaeon]